MNQNKVVRFLKIRSLRPRCKVYFAAKNLSSKSLKGSKRYYYFGVLILNQYWAFRAAIATPVEWSLTSIMKSLIALVIS